MDRHSAQVPDLSPSVGGRVPRGHWLADMWHVTARTLRLSWGMPIWILLSAIYPLIWLVLFGGLFGGVPLPPEVGTSSYLEYFVPGMVAATTIFSSLWAGFGIVLDLESGMLKRMLASPVAHSATAIGYVLASQSGVAVQIGLMIAVALWGMDVSFQASAVDLVAALAAIGLLSVGLSALSHAAAVLVRRQEPLITLANFLSLPLLFLSSVLMPVSLVPDWVRGLMRVNPVHHAVELVRFSVISDYPLALSPWLHAAALLSFSILMLVGLLAAFRRVASA